MIIATGKDISNPNTLYRLRTNTANSIYNNTDSNRHILQRDRVVYNSAFIRKTSTQYAMMIILDASDTLYWEKSTNGGSSWSSAASIAISVQGDSAYGSSNPSLEDGYVYTPIFLNNWHEDIETDLSVFTSIEDYNTYITNVYIPPITVIASNGGGATHIAKVTGQLKDLSNYLSDILIVSGGGGGGMLINDTVYEGADAGGISGSGSNSANQSTGYAFGQGESGIDASGGGSGLYGGYKGTSSKGGGAGSGYIGNSLLSNKKMVGYNVPTSSAESTKTESANVYSASGEANKPKVGNGMAKITPLGETDFFRPNFSSDGRDSVRYDANSTVLYHEGTAGSSIDYYGTGTLVTLNDPPTFNNNSMHITCNYADNNPVYWAYSDAYAQQKVINPNGIIKIGMTATTSNTTIRVHLFNIPDYDLSDHDWLFEFNNPYSSATDYVSLTNSNGSLTLMDENKALPTTLNGTAMEYYLYLTNGIISKIEYYVDGVLYKTFDNISRFNYHGFNTTTEGDHFCYDEVILELYNSRWEDDIDVTISDLHITY